MAYDNMLNPVLEKATNEELKPIVKVLSEKLSNCVSCDPRYVENPEDLHALAGLIANEIREMGGNTFANIFRGEGVSYREVVRDVADKAKASYSQSWSVAKIEQAIIEKFFTDGWNNISDAERAEIITELAPNTKPGEIPVMTAQALFKLGGFTSYKMTLIVVNAVSKALFGRGLTLVANAGLAKTLGILTGPIGWAITGVWTLVDIAGPSYKTTTFCVIYVSAIRQRLIAEGLMA